MVHLARSPPQNTIFSEPYNLTGSDGKADNSGTEHGSFGPEFADQSIRYNMFLFRRDTLTDVDTG